MDLDFKIILEKPTSQELGASAEAQLAVAYLKAMRSGNTRQAEKISEELELIKEAKELDSKRIIAEKEDTERLEVLSAQTGALVEWLENVDKFSVDTLEDTLASRAYILHLVKSDTSMPARRFVVANNYLEDAIINGANIQAPLVMFVDALKDLSQPPEPSSSDLG